MARFEKERIGLVHEETVKDVCHLRLEQEKLQKKVGMMVLHTQLVEFFAVSAGGVAD